MPTTAPDVSALDALFQTGMAMHILGVFLLLMLTRNAMRRAVRRDTPFTPPADTVKALVTIPVGTVTDATEPALRSLLAQEGVDYRVVLVTATATESAAALINRLCREFPRATHVTAGKAERCAQKNHNLLAGITAARPGEDILVFCDSTHLARPDFLARLVEPVASGRAELASGYRFVRPDDEFMGTLVQMLAVRTLHMLWSIKPLSQPWGGATAIARSTFFDNRIPDLWSRTVVDDYSMGPYMQSLGIRSLPVPEACLETRLSGQTVAEAANWFYRQLQFFKFYTPLAWVAASLLPIFYLCMLVYALATLPASIPYFLGMYLISLPYTRTMPDRVSVLRRATAYFLFTVVAAVQLLRTWTSNTMTWQDITYRVKLGGEITDIRRTDEADA